MAQVLSCRVLAGYVLFHGCYKMLRVEEKCSMDVLARLVEQQ